MAVPAWVSVYLKGFAMGAADAVPGVSGGTIALITGIYDRLVDAIAKIDIESGRTLLADIGRGYTADGRRGAWNQALSMDLPFLVVLAFGVLTAVITAANVIEVGVSQYPGPTYAFFFGLILASVYVLRDQLTLDSLRGVTVGLVGFLLAFFVSGITGTSLGAGLLMVFISGAIAICAMVLPGISGSLILLALGQYELMVGTVHTLTNAVFAGATGEVLDPLTILVVFSLGALVGILSFARVVSWALNTYRVETMTFLVALMVGALRAPGERILAATPVWSPDVTAILVGMAVIGGAAVIALDQMTEAIEY